MQPNVIFLASGNPHKIDELQQILRPMGIKLKSTLDYPDAEEVEEDQPDLDGNALKKARFWFTKTGLPSLADDTGLEVKALNGAPGVRSARYAGEKATYEQNVDKLLRELEGSHNRSSQFRTVIAYIDAVGNENLFEGICRGEIITERKGEKGFGYDPVFVPKGYDQTFAEISSEEKNRISHRGKAIQKFIQLLK
ncbi:RdgB/HAM1 family non-canonical purine NTP pyrophosphatase [Rhodohalobacter sp. SW132]|uniref:RdgB/HAM1 family non-canonical purine NTP pyrophosphatase n=1 Tax=Rhodohalobacter sp. SW132 TaxID=2293433 RepID=UPI000E245BDC|nr:RdgB/HAM1 family non-canonical purine NTP pyrophosphatase [Rhodohalobacter sp. SW132]REL33091.1 RdgB/HAM1 family non-canonical purine NTP pyrophosphatase [Rhodohalobacter sp. SW132]